MLRKILIALQLIRSVLSQQLPRCGVANLNDKRCIIATTNDGVIRKIDYPFNSNNAIDVINVNIMGLGPMDSDDDGNIYIVQETTGEIYHFDKCTHQLKNKEIPEATKLQINGTHSLAFNNGFLYSFNNDEFLKIDPSTFEVVRTESANGIQVLSGKISPIDDTFTGFAAHEGPLKLLQIKDEAITGEVVGLDQYFTLTLDFLSASDDNTKLLGLGYGSKIYLYDLCLNETPNNMVTEKGTIDGINGLFGGMKIIQGGCSDICSAVTTIPATTIPATTIPVDNCNNKCKNGWKPCLHNNDNYCMGYANGRCARGTTKCFTRTGYNCPPALPCKHDNDGHCMAGYHQNTKCWPGSSKSN